MPAHRIHINTPSDHDAQRGCDCVLQSAQFAFPGSRNNACSAFFTATGVLILNAVVQVNRPVTKMMFVRPLSYSELETYVT